MQDIAGQVLGVTGSPTRNGGTKYDVAFSDGNSYSTFDGQLAQKASGLVGQAVSARTESKPSRDGQRLFHNLVDIAPQGQLAPGAMPLGGQIITPSIGAGSNVQPEAPQFTGNIQMVSPAQKDANIAKAVAVKAATQIVSSLFQGAGPEATAEALEKLDEVGKHILGVLTGSSGAQEPQVVPTEQTPEAVVAAVNGAAGQEVVSVGATPEW